MKKTFIALSMALASSVAFADSYTTNVFKDTAVTLKGGTNGVGFDVIKGINQYVDVRAGFSQMSISENQTSDGVQFNGKVQLGGWNLLADYRPFAGGFRVTGGAYIPTSKFSATGQFDGSGSITMNGTTYTSADVNSVSANAKWSGIKPYIGIGYDGFNTTNSGFFFTADVGVIFAGSPKVSLSANCTSANPAICSQLNTDLQAQQNSLKSDLNNAKYIPVAQLGIGYRF